MRTEAEGTLISHPGTRAQRQRAPRFHTLGPVHRGRGHPDPHPRTHAQRQRAPRFHTLGPTCIGAEGIPIPRETVCSVTPGQLPDMRQRTPCPCILQAPCASLHGCEAPKGKQSTFHKTSGSVSFPLYSVGPSESSLLHLLKSNSKHKLSSPKSCRDQRGPRSRAGTRPQLCDHQPPSTNSTDKPERSRPRWPCSAHGHLSLLGPS